MSNYDWIKPGVKVRIKTFEEIQKMYPERSMPYYLNEDMDKYCGTTQTIESFHTSTSRMNNKFRVYIQGWYWPETVLLPATTPKGNTL